MKKIFCAIIVICLFVSCHSKSDFKTIGNKDSSEQTYSYPYKATYSSDVTVPGNPKYAEEVLTVWKNFESGRIDSIKKYFADTLTYEDAAGHKYYGGSDGLLNIAKKDIENLDSLRFDISMWQSVHVNDKDEDWVFIWSAERRYSKNKTADTSLIHEQWKIKNDKIVYFNQYRALPAK